jgi:hypothetical protein
MYWDRREQKLKPSSCEFCNQLYDIAERTISMVDSDTGQPTEDTFECCSCCANEYDEKDSDEVYNASEHEYGMSVQH